MIRASPVLLLVARVRRAWTPILLRLIYLNGLCFAISDAGFSIYPRNNRNQANVQSPSDSLQGRVQSTSCARCAACFASCRDDNRTLSLSMLITTLQARTQLGTFAGPPPDHYI